MGRKLELKLSSDQVSDRKEVGVGTVAASPGLGRLKEAVHSFQHGVGELVLEPGQNSLLVVPERLGHADHGIKTAVGRPEVPPLQEGLPRGPIRLLEEVLEAQLHLVGPGCLEVVLAQALKLLALPRLQAAGVLQPQVTGLLEERVGLHLFPSDLVDAVVGQLHDVEPVKGDPGVGEVLLGPVDVGGRHVAGDLLNRLRVSTMLGQVGGEGGHRPLVLAGGPEDHASSLQTEEKGDVVMPTPARRLVHPHPPHLREVLPFDGLSDVVADDPPEPRVVLAHHLRQSVDRHLTGHGDDHGLEQKGEATPGTAPGDLHLGDRLALGALDPRDPGVEVGAVLEEVEVPPGLLGGVVPFRPLGIAAGTGKRGAPFEVHPEIELLLPRGELDLDHLPGRYEPQGHTEERLAVVSTRTPTWGHLSASTPGGLPSYRPEATVPRVRLRPACRP